MFAGLRSDLHICGSGTAAGNMAIIKKAMKSLGCWNWDELADMKRRLA